MGYGVEVRGGSATIKELDTTLFYRKSKGEVFKKRNILDGEYMVGFEHNDGKNMSSAQRRVFNIFDCLKKYERSLVASKKSIRRPEVVQSMAKSTLRLYEARGVKLTPIEVIQGKIEQHLAKGHDSLPKLNKAEKLVLLKHGYSPRAVGHWRGPRCCCCRCFHSRSSWRNRWWYCGFRLGKESSQWLSSSKLFGQ